MGKGTRESAAEVAAYAAATGCSLTTARLHRRAADARWVEWQKSRGISEGARASAPDDSAEWVRAAAARDAAYLAFQRLSDAMAAAPPEQLAALTRAAADARKMWEAACEHAARTASDCGQLIPLTTVRALQEKLIGSGLAPALRAWAQNIAQRLRPEVRAEFFNAERAERPRLYAAIEALDHELEALLSHA